MKFGFLPALTLLFIGLKLTNNIDWSWWWVTAPSWGTLAACLIVWLFCQTVVFVCEVAQRVGETKEQTEKRHAREKATESLEKFRDALKKR